MNEYKFKFSRWNFNTDTFKQRHIETLKTAIIGSRLSCDLDFNSYGIINYEDDDKEHKYPNVSEVEVFNRKVNCMIFNMKETYKNQNRFNKLFIYHSPGKIGNYGFVMLNTETNETLHKYFISYTFEDLLQTINKSLINIKDEAIYKLCYDKENNIKNRNYSNPITSEKYLLECKKQLLQKIEDYDC